MASQQPTGPTGPTGDAVLCSVGYLLMKGGHYIGIEFESALAKFDLNAREFLVLSFVHASHDLSQQQLSECLNLDPTIVVGLLDALEQRYLLTRTKSPADRRRNVLALTPAGLELHNDAVAEASAAQAAFLEPLSATEQDKLQAALRKVLAARLPWLGND